ncbi:hypothetical protein FIBSPDRAFT_885857 [Athelia psychrophila]|uniref:Uncharacterized protein n=1 Tax=Athelia psychrophila TaxID=1759441 RepID=A0A166RHS8_9AGAM|nr:hypothetical protein FIBSPDRAFT_885857 [Fibularhizoctonia sp. CBS 109695]
MWYLAWMDVANSSMFAEKIETGCFEVIAHWKANYIKKSFELSNVRKLRVQAADSFEDFFVGEFALTKVFPMCLGGGRGNRLTATLIVRRRNTCQIWCSGANPSTWSLLIQLRTAHLTLNICNIPNVKRIKYAMCEVALTVHYLQGLRLRKAIGAVSRRTFAIEHVSFASRRVAYGISPGRIQKIEVLEQAVKRYNTAPEISETSHNADSALRVKCDEDTDSDI